ncbi:flagellar biosynthesis protein FlgA [Micromonospora sp. WMMA1949]|uniref:flagellar biosynthesis protein FlgA n=1 Tax=unclassified Micromonospora TaxID=2617518 RepID=UPI0022B653CC|nr:MULTISPECIES: flagellar biosynthesis protein FlgA [unclassified Micromonospora]MCZ7425904.1 flagellar biosynthesis protein FlgA [Micromonospora sp. WMMA1949]WBC10424.1 flagellar biosynthesis protein FlgA [Micromonospora sp. WMMA1947]
MTDDEGTLRPVRWRGLPRRRTLLRVTLVAVLLGLAAAVLQTPPSCPPPGSSPAASAAASPSGGIPALPAGAVGVPIRLAEPAALAVLRPGARVDLLVVPAGGTPDPTLLAPRALVLDVVGATGAVDGSSALYLALPPEQARRAVGLPEGSRFAVVVRG